MNNQPQIPGITHRGKSKQGTSTYDEYAGPDAETAKQFLAAQSVKEANYYIIVHTPEGVWGADTWGLYLEHLLPFQTNLAAAECDGQPWGTPNNNSLIAAA